MTIKTQNKSLKVPLLNFVQENACFAHVDVERPHRSVLGSAITKNGNIAAQKDLSKLKITPESAIHSVYCAQETLCLAHLDVERPHRSIVGSAEHKRSARVYHHTPHPVLVEVLPRVERERARETEIQLRVHKAEAGKKVRKKKSTWYMHGAAKYSLRQSVATFGALREAR